MRQEGGEQFPDDAAKKTKIMLKFCVIVEWKVREEHIYLLQGLRQW